MALLCLVTILAGLLISLVIVYDATPKWKAQYSTHYDNGAPVSPVCVRVRRRCIAALVNRGAC
jgi:hypothetical protein